MRLDDERESSNVEDRRGGGGGFPGGGAVRVGGIGAVVLVIGALLLGVDPRVVLDMVNGGGGGVPQSEQRTAPPTAQQQAAPGDQDAQRRFVSQVLASTEDVWSAQFKQMGRNYNAPELVLFSGGTNSGCGLAQTAIGPFYCPEDQKVYLDLRFFQELSGRLGATGDFARAYVIAHEIGHHVQNQLGVLGKVSELRQRGDAQQDRALSVRTELQADCFAGVWGNQANRTRHILEPGDVESGLGAASAVGDDTLQRRSQGTVQPDTFTHGSSAQRVRWFRQGFQSGDIRQCDTFGSQAP